MDTGGSQDESGNEIKVCYIVLESDVRLCYANDSQRFDLAKTVYRLYMVGLQYNGNLNLG